MIGKETIRVAAFTGGITVPSARFRVRQHSSALSKLGVEISEMSSYFGIYPPESKALRLFWGGATLAERIPQIICSYNYDVVLLQREMLSSFATFECLTKSPRVLDVDDAIYLNRNGDFARRLAQISDRVICGNHYLADWFSNWNKSVTVVPTAINTDLYVPIIKLESSVGATVIGWIGTSGNLKYLYAIEAALAIVLKAYPEIILRIVCDKKPEFSLFDMSRCEYILWSEKCEIENIQGMDIGIMLLENSEWAKGKCSFKMLQYMACGVPVVVSPVGMNVEVLSMGSVGMGAKSDDDWIDSLVELIRNQKLRANMGVVGRQVVSNYFSISKVAPQIKTCLTF